MKTAILRFLNGFSCEEADLWEASPVRLFGPIESDAETLLTVHFAARECVDIAGTSAITAARTTATREEWISAFRRSGGPVSETGIRIRPNPVSDSGEANLVAVYRFAVISFDAVPLPLQVSLIARLPLPVAAVITDGGGLLHAWVYIGAENASAYNRAVSHLFRLLAPFGVNQANRFPDSPSPLPGSFRRSANSAVFRQQLLFLNPSPSTSKIIP